MVTGTCEGHREPHSVKAGEPVHREIRECIGQRRRDDTVGVVQEKVTCYQCNTAVDQGRHIAETQDLRALDVEILCQEDNRHTDNVYGYDKADCQFQGVPDIFTHVSRKEETDNGPRISLSGCCCRRENTGQRIQAGQQHKSKEEIDKA